MTITTTNEMTALTKDERSCLAQLEESIQAGQQSFFEVGAALTEIRDDKLYRDEFATFEDYCKERWGFSRPHAYRYIDSAGLSENLSPIGDILPANEAQCRPLTKLEPEEQQEAWSKVLDTAKEKDKQVTAKLVSDVVKEMKEPAVQMAAPETKASNAPAEAVVKKFSELTTRQKTWVLKQLHGDEGVMRRKRETAKSKMRNGMSVAEHASDLMHTALLAFDGFKTQYMTNSGWVTKADKSAEREHIDGILHAVALLPQRIEEVRKFISKKRKTDVHS